MENVKTILCAKCGIFGPSRKEALTPESVATTYFVHVKTNHFESLDRSTTKQLAKAYLLKRETQMAKIYNGIMGEDPYFATTNRLTDDELEAFKREYEEQ